MNKNFAETLKKLRAVKSISQRELAEKIFVTRSVIAKWESGYNLPNAFMIKRICKVLDVNEYDLIRILLESDDELNVIILARQKNCRARFIACCRRSFAERKCFWIYSPFRSD